MWRGALIAATLLVACTARGQAAERDVLVLVEDASVRSTHSIFLDDLRQQGWKVSIRSAEDKTLRLRDWDDWLYSKIAIFASSIPGGAYLKELRLLLVVCPVLYFGIRSPSGHSCLPLPDDICLAH